MYVVESNYFELCLVCCFNLLKIPSSSSVGLMWPTGEENAAGKALQSTSALKKALRNMFPGRKTHLCEKFGLSNAFSITAKFCSRSRDKIQLTMVGSTCKNRPSPLHALSHFGEARETGIHICKPTSALEKEQRSQQENAIYSSW